MSANLDAVGMASGTVASREGSMRMGRGPQIVDRNDFPRVTTLAGVAALMVVTAGCDAAQVEPNAMPGASPARGRTLIMETGCGACHAIPGVEFPKGMVGPPLEGFADRALIAGRFPNRPGYLTRWVRDAHAMAPGTGMPPNDLTEQEARDVAAYLYTLHDD